jgi:2-polyprenyl-3-methyl-5-hydroxy-6-metoxy-1,4-benzoquinol methylase
MERNDFNQHYKNGLHNVLFRWIDIKKSRLLNKYIKGSNLRICDLGCGTGKITSMLAKNNEVYGIDLDNHLLHTAEKNGLKPLNAKIDDIPFEDGFFDVVIMIDSIEHADSRERLAKELYRIIRKDGKIIIFTPAYDSFLWNLGDAFARSITRNKTDHISPFTKESLEYFLTKNNFKVTETRRINCSLGLFAMAEK